MTNKNILKILVIMIAVLSLFAVSCRKSGGGGGYPTPQNPNKNIGRLLIISSDGKTNINSIPLSFSYANATVSDFQSTSANLSLTKDNFIIENGTLKIGNDFDLSTLEAGKENEATLTFKLTPSLATPITKDTDTATIYIGKMQTNIGTNDFAKQLSGQGKIDNDKDLFGDKNREKLIQFDFNPELSKDSNNYLVFTNHKEGSKDNLISKDKFYSNFNEIIKTTWQSFVDSYSIETSIEDVTNAIVKLQFEPAIFYEPYIFKFIMTNGEFVLTNK